MPRLRRNSCHVTPTRGLQVVVALLALTAAAALPPGLSAQGGSSGTERQSAVDLKVAVHNGVACGEFRDALPVLVAQSGLQPGDRTPPVTVCAVNRVSANARLTLAVIERVETDTSCSGEEATIDATCGGNGTGELGGSLLVHISTQPGCTGAFKAPTSIAFQSLAASAVPVLPDMKINRVQCISLALEHRPASEQAAVAAQTDSVGWRYAFDLST